jgi:hypothetical protein
MEGTETTDSGYTEVELDRIFSDLTKGVVFAWDEEELALAMTIGLADGDVVELSELGTVLLSTPRAEIDGRVSAIKSKIAAGIPLRDAVEATVS